MELIKIMIGNGAEKGGEGGNLREKGKKTTFKKTKTRHLETFLVSKSKTARAIQLGGGVVEQWAAGNLLRACPTTWISSPVLVTKVLKARLKSRT